ncbi:TerC family protein [Flavisolibacter nicotianae]|uniref:TerC family protein n=1 Tax=Flavisolibacter nicotianae TaxID=2364882 RepID=UPI000EB43AE8|nr:TerC family protein [Flavisolibacter nicotianae]
MINLLEINLTNPGTITALLTLTVLEIILGVDNIIFISIVTNKLPAAQQPRARLIGLLLAMVFRIFLLLAISWIIRLTNPIFSIPFIVEDDKPLGISWKDLILIAGGIFLVFKSTLEIHHKLEKAKPQEAKAKAASAVFGAVILQIVMVDAVFSFDSILTAIGLVDEVWVMITAVIISMTIMILFSGIISRFINKHPTLQILALAFLIMIGVMLMAEGFHQHINKSYIYTAIAFSLIVEMINMRLRKNHPPIDLNNESL